MAALPNDPPNFRLPMDRALVGEKDRLTQRPDSPVAAIFLISILEFTGFCCAAAHLVLNFCAKNGPWAATILLRTQES